MSLQRACKSLGLSACEANGLCEFIDAIITKSGPRRGYCRKRKARGRSRKKSRVSYLPYAYAYQPKRRVYRKGRQSCRSKKTGRLTQAQKDNLGYNTVVELRRKMKRAGLVIGSKNKSAMIRALRTHC